MSMQGGGNVDVSLIIKKLQDRVAESVTAIAVLESQLEAVSAELNATRALLAQKPPVQEPAASNHSHSLKADD